LNSAKFSLVHFDTMTDNSSSSAPKKLTNDASDADATKSREDFVGRNPLTYRKWEDLPYESDEDDCHPNIEIGTWRRLKEKMRREKGIKKKVPEMHDKWNVTTTNKNYHIDPVKPPKSSEEQKKNSDEKESSQSTNSDAPPTTSENPPSSSQQEVSATATAVDAQPAVATAVKPAAQPETSTAAAQPSSAAPAPSTDKPAVDNEPYKARSNPQTFLDEHLDTVRKFATTKNDGKAQRFIKKHPEIVHEAAEGFLITHAVDRAVEGAEKPELARLSRRCLTVHNLVQSCSTQNVSPEFGVTRFYEKIESDKKLSEQYKIELNKQCEELMERIEIRRVERLAELQDVDKEDEEDEKAPLGPGGLDPTEVLNSLPEAMQDSFVNSDVEGLKKVLAEMEPAQAEYHMQRCIDAGLWVQPTDENGLNGNDDDDDDVSKGNAVETEKEKEKPKEVPTQKTQPKIDELD